MRSSTNARLLSWLLLLCGAFALFSGTARAEQNEQPRVVVLTDPVPMTVLADALIRVRGELAAAGLSAELRERKASDPNEYKPDPGVYGVLAFEQLGPVILIRAFGPAAHTPITESVDTQSSAVNAEVLAVRAVETLRAAMVQQPGHDTSDVPDAVKNFARPAQPQNEPKADKPEPVAEKKVEPETKLTPPPAKPPPPAARPPAEPPRHLVGWLAGGLSLEPNASARPRAELGVLAGPSWGFLAASFETSVGSLKLVKPAGSAQISSRSFALAAGARLRIAQGLQLLTRVATGYAIYDVTGDGGAGYLGQHLKPRSAFGALGVSTAYWLSDSFAFALDLGSRLALDAPRVRIAGEDVVALDRPSFDVGLAAMFSPL